LDSFTLGQFNVMHYARSELSIVVSFLITTTRGLLPWRIVRYNRKMWDFGWNQFIISFITVPLPCRSGTGN